MGIDGNCLPGLGEEIGLGDVAGKIHVVNRWEDWVKSVGLCMAFVRQDLGIGFE